MKPQKKKYQTRFRRKMRTRARILGNSSRPRMSVYRSLKHIYVQLIDDEAKKTVVSSSTNELKLKKITRDAAKKVGADIAKKALAAGISQAVFDKSFYKFHGRIKALADSAREHGLKF